MQDSKTRQDSIDQSIDSFLSAVGSLIVRELKWVAILGAAAAIFWVFVLPIWQDLLPILGTGIALLFQLFFAVMFMIVQFVALFWFLGRGRTYWVKPGETGVGFKDYKGNPEVLESARRIVTLLRGVKDFKDMGGQPLRGLLLVGPPGTGKSYLAQAISTEAGVPFGYASAPSFQNMFMGIGNLRVMMLYGKARGLAKKYGACILFIDEIDALGSARSNQGPSTGMGGMMFGGNNGMLNELLLQMDPPPQDQGRKARILRSLGLRRRKAEMPPVLTIGATNLVEVLDQALLRPGRFDRKITVDLPDAEGRREILDYYLAKVKHENLDMDKLVFDTIGYTPVAVKHVINEAVVVAHFEGRHTINYHDFTMARETHEWGLRQPIKGMSLEEKRRIAYHEAGHAFAQLKLLPRQRLSKVTIIRHGQALGLSATKPVEEMYTQTKDEVMADIQTSLASRASEELFLGMALTGVTSDLEQATRLAGAAIGMFGMNGSLYSYRAFGQITPDPMLKKEIDKLLKEQYAKVKALLDSNRPSVIAMAEALLVNNELDEDEIKALLAQAEVNRAAPTLSEPIPITALTQHGVPVAGVVGVTTWPR
ncbi:MAG: AAA family ATPase [Chloroflexi bacterium]|nr:AAA family ATPase [Chloroflexota bacterium]